MPLLLCCLALAGFVACGGDDTEGDAAPTASADAGDESADDSSVDLAAALRNAATAQEVHITSTGTYTDSVDDLFAAGAETPPGVELIVAMVDRGRSYCIEALAEDGSAVMSIESGGLPVEGPCEPGKSN